MTVHSQSTRRTDSVRITIALLDLGCGGGGSLAIERALSKVPGVREAYVNPATEVAYIEFDPSRCDQDVLVGTIQRLGYRTTDPRWH